MKLKQDKQEQEFKTRFLNDVEQEQKEQEQIINNYWGDENLKPRQTI